MIEKKRRKKELKIIIFLVFILAILSFLEFVLLKHDAEFSLSSSILIFFIINLNLILLLLLIFLILRNLVKLYYERKTQIPGSRIKTRLLMAFILITLIPNAMLFISSANFINSSIAYWFNAPVEQALKNSLKVGQNYYKYIEKNHVYFIKDKVLNKDKADYKKIQKEIDLSPFDFIEIYSSDGKRLKIFKNKLIKNLEIKPYANIKNIEKFPATLTQDLRQGSKLVKTIILNNKNYFCAGVVADSEIFRSLNKISEGYDEYQQIKLMKNSVKITYILALFVVSFLVLFSAIWFAFYFAKTITDPILELVTATKKVSKGDLDIELVPNTNDEVGFLVSSFNSMTIDLKITKETLQMQNEELENRTRYIETILRNISTGVIALDSDGRITAANMAFGSIFKKDYKTLSGKLYKDVLPEKYCKIASKYIESSSSVTEEEVPLQLSLGKDNKNLLLRFSTLHDENNSGIGVVTACEDVTELEKAQRMAAWREVARQIAHEVKNPLTPISLAAQRLQRKFPELLENKIFMECTKTIIEHVGIMRSLVNEFATYARFPSPQKDIANFNDVLNATIPLYQEKYPGIDFRISIDKDLPEILMDKRQISQALINLIDNAAAAMNNKGSIYIDFKYSKKDAKVIIKFVDSGPGVKADKKTRLFEPYFSTKKSGTGLGLTIVNSIISSHGGSIKVDEHHTGGACFLIELPSI